MTACTACTACIASLQIIIIIINSIIIILFFIILGTAAVHMIIIQAEGICLQGAFFCYAGLEIWFVFPKKFANRCFMNKRAVS